MEGQLRQADQVHALAVLAPGQGGGGREPAGVAAHDLDDGHKVGAVHRRVADDLFHDHADILGRGAVAGRVVGEHKVVVDGLGHAHEADAGAHRAAVPRQLVDGVHAVIAADIEEPLDVQLFEDREQLFVDLFVLLRRGQLIAAAPQEGGGRALQQFDVHEGFQAFGQVAHLFVQQALDAVQHAVDVLRPAHLAGLEHAGEAGIDDGGRAAALADDCVWHSGSSLFFMAVSARFRAPGTIPAAYPIYQI